MKKDALHYKAYKMLLESDSLTFEQKQKLLEIGFLDKIKSFFGGGVDVGKDLAKIFKGKVNQRQLSVAKDNITKAIKDLKDIAVGAGVDPKVVAEFLQGVLKDADVNPADVAAVKPSGGEATATGAVGTTGAEAKPGTPFAMGQPMFIPMIVTAAAQAAGQDPKKAAEEAEDKKVDAPKATQVLSKAIAQQTKADLAKVQKVIDYLIKNKHMVAEGRAVTTATLYSAADEVKKSFKNSLVMERWNAMAGLSLIKEAEETVAAAVEPTDLEVAKKKFGSTFEEVRKAFKPEDVEDEVLVAVLNMLDSLDSVQIK